MTDEKSQLSAATLLAEISDKLDRVASTSAQASLQTARAVRILDANQQLSARDRMALVDVVETQRRLTARLERAVESLSPRPASLTVVADEKSGPSREDDTGVFYHFKGARHRVPTKVLVPLALIVGALVHWFGAKFPDILKWMTAS